MGDDVGSKRDYIDYGYSFAAFLGLVLGFAYNAIWVYGAYLKAGSIWGTWDEIREWHSPYNVTHFVVEFVVFSPMFLFLWLRSRRRKRLGIADD